MTAREPVEGWRWDADRTQWTLRVKGGAVASASVAVELRSGLWVVELRAPSMYVAQTHDEFDSLKAAKLAAEDYARTQLQAALDALENPDATS